MAASLHYPLVELADLLFYEGEDGKYLSLKFNKHPNKENRR